MADKFDQGYQRSESENNLASYSSDAGQDCDVSDFHRQTAQPSHGLVREFWDFIKDNKKWWLLPIIAVLLLFGVLVFLGGGAAAPFIYTLW